MKQSSIWSIYLLTMKYKAGKLWENVLTRVIEISEKPKDSWPQDLTQKDDKGGEVEDVDHTHEPVLLKIGFI